MCASPRAVATQQEFWYLQFPGQGHNAPQSPEAAPTRELRPREWSTKHVLVPAHHAWCPQEAVHEDMLASLLFDAAYLIGQLHGK